ncbi:MAG: chalcone isomerase family protein [Rhodoferax sp.]
MCTPHPTLPAQATLKVDLLPRRKMLVTAAAALAGCTLGVAQAQTQASPIWPEVNSALAEARLAGSIRLRVWGFEVYDAQLWVLPGFRAGQFAQYPLALSLRYLRSLKGAAIAEHSLKEMRGVGPIAPAQADPWLRAMTQTFPDVQAGDRLTGLHQPGVGARFWLNGQPHGDIADANFSSAFFGIWLAEGTSEPAMRRELLANAAP